MDTTELSASFLSDVATGSPSTAKNYRWGLKVFAEYLHASGATPQDVDLEHFKAWLADYHNKDGTPLAPNSARAALRSAQAFHTWAAGRVFEPPKEQPMPIEPQVEPAEQTASYSPPMSPPTVPATMLVPPSPPEPPPIMRVQRPAVSRPRQVLEPVAPKAPYRRSLSLAFKSQEDIVLVYRLKDDRETMLPKEWPRSYIDSCGLNEGGIELFVNRHIVPDWGGGTYIVRARSANGESFGEAMVSVAGESRDPSAAQQAPTIPGAIPPSPPGIDPMVWMRAFTSAAEVGRGLSAAPPAQLPEPKKTIADAISEVQALRTLEAMRAGPSEVDGLKATVLELKSQLDALRNAPPPMAPAPAQTESELDKMLKYKQLFGMDKPAGPDPIVAALAEQVRALASSIQQIASKAEGDRMERLLVELKEVKEKIRATEEGGPRNFQGLMDQVEEIKKFSDQLQPPSGSSVVDLASQFAQHWTPEAIANLLERKSVAEANVAFAKARASVIRSGGELPAAGGTGGQPAVQQQAEPPLAKFIPEDERLALLDATEDEEILGALFAIVTRLNGLNDVGLNAALAKIPAALRAGIEGALKIQVGQLLRLVYGEDIAKKAYEEVSSVLLRNAKMVLEQVDKVTGSEATVEPKKES